MSLTNSGLTTSSLGDSSGLLTGGLNSNPLRLSPNTPTGSEAGSPQTQLLQSGAAPQVDSATNNNDLLNTLSSDGSTDPNSRTNVGSDASVTSVPFNSLSSTNTLSQAYTGDFGRGFNPDENIFTFTGTDIRVMIEPVNQTSGQANTKQLLELNTITVSVYREKIPVRACGYINPKGHGRGRRTIAGTLILTQFTVDVMYRFLTGGYTGTDISKDSQYVKVDQLPPFNMTMFFQDEYGHSSYRRILGVDFETDGTVYSLEDMKSEQTLTYKASDFTPLIPLGQSAKTSDYTPYSTNSTTNVFGYRQTKNQDTVATPPSPLTESVDSSISFA